MNLRLYDAHNHLHDDRLSPYRDEILRSFRPAGIERLVVNGSCEEDWPKVLALAREVPEVIPSFGYHPWYVNERSPDWQEVLVRHLDSVPSAVGEIGLDRWIRGFDSAQQEEVFIRQLQLAAERNLPVSIHCLQAWGRLLELLQSHSRPRCGFVLHSFGGSRELIRPLADLGAFFSLPGYFAHERKQRQRDTFKHVPPDRLLIETDAPDQSLPGERVEFSLPPGCDGKPLNHPANLGAVYRFAADLLEHPVEQLAAQVESNFQQLFGTVIDPGKTHPSATANPAASSERADR